jgi:hypothetical protein
MSVHALSRSSAPSLATTRPLAVDTPAAPVSDARRLYFSDGWTPGPPALTQRTDGILPGRLIVSVKDGQMDAARDHFAQQGIHVISELGAVGIFIVAVKAGSEDAVMDDLAAQPFVQSVESDRWVGIARPLPAREVPGDSGPCFAPIPGDVAGIEEAIQGTGFFGNVITALSALSKEKEASTDVLSFDKAIR